MCRNWICPTGEAPLRGELCPGDVGLNRDISSWEMVCQQGAPLFSNLALTTLGLGMANL